MIIKKTIALILVFVLFSCKTGSEGAMKKKPLYEILEQKSDGGGNIHFFEILTEPNEIKMLQNDASLRKKIKETDLKNANFLILNMGEKATEGNSITVESVTETDTNIIVVVKETEPEVKGAPIQGFVYPFCVVKINSKKNIIVK